MVIREDICSVIVIMIYMMSIKTQSRLFRPQSDMLGPYFSSINFEFFQIRNSEMKLLSARAGKIVQAICTYDGFSNFY